MNRFAEVIYNSDSQTADIGAGLIWDDVYAALEPHGVNVVGGRVSGVGVAGFTLGGGLFVYTWILHYKKLIKCRRIFMENESIRFDNRHCDCVRASQTGWNRDDGNKDFRSRLVFWSQGSCI